MSNHTIARRGAVAAVFAAIAFTAACGTEQSVVGQPPPVVTSYPGDHTIDVPDPSASQGDHTIDVPDRFVPQGRPTSEK